MPQTQGVCLESTVGNEGKIFIPSEDFYKINEKTEDIQKHLL